MRPTIEERMLAQVGGLLGRVGHLVRSCHERWDRKGYPDRLAAEDIPLVARIVYACDACSAMTTDRPYRAARSPRRRSRLGLRGHVRPGGRPRALRPVVARGASRRPGQPAVFEHAPARLALRAVEDRVLLEVDARDRRPAVGARLAEAVVHLVQSCPPRRPGRARGPAEELPDRRGRRSISSLESSVVRAYGEASRG